MLTEGCAFGDRLLATTSPHTHTVDNVALLGLVPETAGLVRTRRAGCAVDDVELAELLLMYSQQMFNEYNQDTGVLTPPPAKTGGGLPYAAHGGGVECPRTSQQRTRSRKRITSLCFFFCSSSRYLWAPI